MPVVYTYIPTSSSFVNVFVFLMSVGFLYIRDMTFHLCVYTMQPLSSLLYSLSPPLPPPSLFASPLLFFFTIILPPSLYPSFLPSLISSPPSPSLLSLALFPPLSPFSSPFLPTFLLSPLSLLLPFPLRLVLT